MARLTELRETAHRLRSCPSLPQHKWQQVPSPVNVESSWLQGRPVLSKSIKLATVDLLSVFRYHPARLIIIHHRIYHPQHSENLTTCNIIEAVSVKSRISIASYTTRSDRRSVHDV